MTGITFITFLFLLLGLLAHGLKQFGSAKKANPALTFALYYGAEWWQSAVGVVFALVGYFALPEIIPLLPEDIVKFLGVADHPQQTVLSSFLIGFLGNSLADLPIFGDRFNAISGVKK